MKIKVGKHEYDVEEARTLEEKEKGLTGKEQLAKDEGMLFFFNPPEAVSFTMVGMKFPLDIVFIDENEEVVQVTSAKPEEEPIDCEIPVSYVLEVNKGSGIKEGDALEFIEGPVMKVLFQDGSTQFEIWGGERIISRRETKVLIKKALKAKESESDSDYKALGKYIFKVFKAQNEREPEYVQTPD